MSPDTLCEEQERHTYRLGPTLSLGYIDSALSSATYSGSDSNSTTDSTYCCSSNCDTIAYYLSEESEEEAKLRHAAEMRKRDLSYLWKEQPLRRLHIILRRPLVIFQPCWSSRRWRSVT